MMMRGDMQKVVDQINPILEAYAARLKALEEAVDALAVQKVEKNVKKSPK